MHATIYRTLVQIVVLGTCFISTSLAITLFEEDFENFHTKGIADPRPVYAFHPLFADELGPGRLFEISSSTSHSGLYSMRFNYNGLNGFCNICGTTSYNHKSGLGGVDYFVESTGLDLTSSGPSAKPGRLIYNKTNGFSKWEIISIENETATNDKLVLKLLKEGVTGEVPAFNDNDDVKIARQCGVDGIIGSNQVDRRSDCDRGITWFTNVGGSQARDQTLYRRVYLKAEIASPVISSKLRYWTFPDNFSAVLLASSEKHPGKLSPVFTGIKQYEDPSSPLYYLYQPAVEFERGVWYYIEEMFKPESAPGAMNGAYKLWFAKSGEEPASENASPLLSITGISLPVVSRTSFWGNTQHLTHSIGVWHIDDMIISDSWNGPVAASGNDTAPPKPPQPNQ